MLVPSDPIHLVDLVVVEIEKWNNKPMDLELPKSPTSFRLCWWCLNSFCITIWIRSRWWRWWSRKQYIPDGPGTPCRQALVDMVMAWSWTTSNLQQLELGPKPGGGWCCYRILGGGGGHGGSQTLCWNWLWWRSTRWEVVVVKWMVLITIYC